MKISPIPNVEKNIEVSQQLKERNQEKLVRSCGNNEGSNKTHTLQLLDKGAALLSNQKSQKY